jgi:hypothetical protein
LQVVAVAVEQVLVVAAVQAVIVHLLLVNLLVVAEL